MAMMLRSTVASSSRTVTCTPAPGARTDRPRAHPARPGAAAAAPHPRHHRFGRIGQALADRARPFGMKLLVADPYVAPKRDRSQRATPMHLDEMLPLVDLLTIHAR